MNKIPSGYYVYETGTDYVVLCCGMSKIFSTAPESIIHEGVEYVRGRLEPIPMEVASHIGSMRRYIKKKYSPRRT